MIELYVLLIIMIIGAIIAIRVEDLLSCVIAVGVIGLSLSIAFLILKAPDLAITQLVVEILCLIILIRATLRKDLPFSTTGRWILNTIIVIFFILIFLAAAAKCLKDLPGFGYPMMSVSKEYIEKAIEVTGAVNVVSAIILDFRAYDTLGEATILFTAVIGVLAIVRKIGKKKEGTKIEDEHE